MLATLRHELQTFVPVSPRLTEMRAALLPAIALADKCQNDYDF